MISLDDSGCYGQSSGNFSITGRFELLTPNSTGIALEYDGATTYEITWNVYGGVSTAQLRYATDGIAGCYSNIIENVSANNQSYNWTVPNAIGPNLSIMVADKDNLAINDTSANPFAIKGNITLDYPNATSGNWTVGEIQYINWTPTGTYVQNVLLQYYNGTAWNGNWSAAPGSTGQARSYQLPANVPDDINGSVQARVITQEGNASVDVSDSYGTFSIKGVLGVTEPDNSGVIWKVGESPVISWGRTGSGFPKKKP